jgi:hypothetical protein
VAVPEEIQRLVDSSVEEFKREVRALINKHNFDTYSSTPDFVLAEYLTDCLLAFGNSVKNRDRLGRSSV